MKTVFLCSQEFDGILCGVYDAYASHLPLNDCRLEFRDEYEPSLFCEYRNVPLDPDKAAKVSNTIQTRFSQDVYRYLYRTALHKNADRADWIFQFIRLGLSVGRRVMDHLQEPSVFKILEMNRQVWREFHSLIEFCRFSKFPSGLYYSLIGPENNVLELVAEHFADRFPDTDWIIYDEIHRRAALHSSKGQWFVKEKITKEEKNRLFSERSFDVYADLWKAFFQSIGIKERENPRCQRTMLPIRYRRYMTEFQESKSENETRFPNNDMSKYAEL